MCASYDYYTHMVVMSFCFLWAFNIEFWMIWGINLRLRIIVCAPALEVATSHYNSRLSSLFNHFIVDQTISISKEKYLIIFKHLFTNRIKKERKKTQKRIWIESETRYFSEVPAPLIRWWLSWSWRVAHQRFEVHWRSSSAWWPTLHASRGVFFQYLNSLAPIFLSH